MGFLACVLIDMTILLFCALRSLPRSALTWFVLVGAILLRNLTEPSLVRTTHVFLLIFVARYFYFAHQRCLRGLLSSEPRLTKPAK